MQNPTIEVLNAFVTKLNAAGSQLVYSSLVGGPDSSSAASAVDASGSAYITGQTKSSNQFPFTFSSHEATSSGPGELPMVLPLISSPPRSTLHQHHRLLSLRSPSSD